VSRHVFCVPSYVPPYVARYAPSRGPDRKVSKELFGLAASLMPATLAFYGRLEAHAHLNAMGQVSASCVCIARARSQIAALLAQPPPRDGGRVEEMQSHRRSFF